MQDQLTIDIHYNKLLDWLLSRRHCKAEWRENALVIRERINNAIQDMPATEELTELLRGTYINYFHCMRIVELLKDTESGTKNIFGRYGSQRMKDWQEVTRLYEKDDLYLAEAAQLLSRNVSYEVPSLKRQIAKCKQTQNDSTRKQSEYSSLEAETKDKFNKKCKQMGIKGEKVKSELLWLVKDLPREFDTMAERSKDLVNAVEYYVSFRKFVLERESKDANLVPTLQYVQRHGNTTVYEFTNGRKPETVIPPELDIPEVETAEETADEIDWGAAFDVEAEAGGEAVDIMKDINEGTIDFGDADTTDAIDWSGIDLDLGDIQVEDGGVSTEQTSTDNVVEETADDGVAVGQMALSLLDNVETRTKYIDDLYELDAFLMMRASELKRTGDVITAAIFDSAPTDIQLDEKAVAAMRERTRDMLAKFNDAKLQMMMSIRSSTRYVDKLAQSITGIQTQAQKFAAMQRLMVNKRNEALERQKELEPKLDLIKQKTLVLKKQIEQEVSKKYKNRPVNIMGEINVM